MEALTINPSNGDLYIGLEDSSKAAFKVPYSNGSYKFSSYEKLFKIPETSDMGNGGVEGLTWYKGDLYFGTQTDATLFRYTLSGTQVSKKSLKKVTSNIKEIAGLDYDPEKDYLWVIDSEKYKIFLFDGAATKVLKEYDISSFADWNPEAICVDKKHGCIWIGEDCNDDNPSKLHKVPFDNL